LTVYNCVLAVERDRMRENIDLEGW